MYSCKFSEFKGNPAVIYEFSPERSVKGANGSKLIEHTWFFQAGQYRDLFNAYQYAEEEILPYIQQHGIEAVSKTIFLGWIKNVHQRLGKTLLENPDNAKAGEFTKEIILRWHVPTAVIMAEMVNYLDNPSAGKTHKSIAKVLASHGIENSDVIKFLKLLDKIKIMPHSILPTSQLALASQQKYRGIPNFFYVFSKLSFLYHTNQLSQEELVVVDKITKPGLLGEQVEPQMQAFAQATLQKWQNLATGTPTPNKVAIFLSEIFFQLYQIHPFENANKRTTCCLINIILGSLKLPFIIFCIDKTDTDLYKKILTTIEKDQAPLAALIEDKIKAELIKPYANPEQEQILIGFLKNVELAYEIKSRYPDFDINAEISRILSEGGERKFESNPHLACEKFLFTGLRDCQKRLEDQMAQKFLQKASFLNKNPEDERVAIIQKLEDLTGLKNWKKKGLGSALQVWQEFDTKEEAHSNLDVLKKFAAMKLSVLEAKGNTFLLMCTMIDSKKLLALEVQRLQTSTVPLNLPKTTHR